MTLTEEILTYLAAHPGVHRPRDVAEAIHRPAQPVAMALRRLAATGRVNRYRNERQHNGPHSVGYSATTRERTP